MRFLLFVAALFSLMAFTGCTETKEVPIEVEKTVEASTDISQEDYDRVVRERNLANTKVNELEEELAALEAETSIATPNPTTNALIETIPTFTIKHESGPLGTMATIYGEGWVPGILGLVTVRIDGEIVLIIEPDSNGMIWAEFEVPSYLAAGSSYQCEVSDNYGNASTSSFDVIESTTQEVVNPDIRNANWGMSKEEVKLSETEGILFTEADDMLAYDGVIVSGLKSALGYLFNLNNELFGVNYVITEPHSNKTAFIADYNTLKEKLTTKYGPPDEDEEIWKDDLWMDKPEDWGLAIVTGDLMYYCTWHTSNLTIFLELSGDNYKVDFKLMYQCDTISSDRGITGLEGL